MKFNLKGHASMLGANVMWGLMSPVSKLVMTGGLISPFVLTDLRIGGAMILFWIASLFQKQERVSNRDMVSLFFAAMFAIVLNQGSFLFGVSLTSPADASIITTSMPLWAMILAAFILKEPITGKKVIGIACGAAGAMLLILGSRTNQPVSASGSDKAILGDLLVLFAQFCYAFYLVYYKDFVNKYSLVTIMKWLFTYSFICVLPFSYNSLAETQWSDLTPATIGDILFIVVGATFISYMLIVIGQKNLRPTVAGMYNYVQPVVACIVAISLGLDSFNIIKGIAVVLIFGGVYLVTISKSRQDLESQKR